MELYICPCCNNLCDENGDPIEEYLDIQCNVCDELGQKTTEAVCDEQPKAK